jgi:two-component system, OmpR family, sensor histidine kinase KdpD
VKSSQGQVGVLAVVPEESAHLDSPEQFHLLEIFASQTALAIERAQSADAAREALLRAETEQMRSGLLSAVSHDLRTPLAAITGAASSLRSQSQQLSEDTRHELLESIESEADRLSRLVNNLLEMTRLDSGSVQVRREWYPLEELTGAALTRLDRILEGRNVTTSLSPDLMVSVDAVLFEQVLWNLLENASKYTPAGSPISIAAWEDNEEVAIEISDSGPGFASGEELLVWDKFYRGRAAGARGAGLGLPICRAIVTAHGGQIDAANQPEGGAVIRIRLPQPGPPPEVPVD